MEREIENREAEKILTLKKHNKTSETDTQGEIMKELTGIRLN